MILPADNAGDFLYAYILFQYYTILIPFTLCTKLIDYTTLQASKLCFFKGLLKV